MLPVHEIIRVLSAVLGKKLTALAAGVKDTRAIDCWLEGTQSYSDAEQKLRFAYHVVMILSVQDSPTVVRAWMAGGES